MEKPLKDKLAYWTRHVEKHVDGGLGLAEYCRIHGLKSRQLAYWKRKIMAEKVCFVEIEPRRVPLVDKTSPDVSAGVLIKIGRIEIELYPGFVPSVLEDALGVITRIC
jgi:hypothetical protein